MDSKKVDVSASTKKPVVKVFSGKPGVVGKPIEAAAAVKAPVVNTPKQAAAPATEKKAKAEKKVRQTTAHEGKGTVRAFVKKMLLERKFTDEEIEAAVPIELPGAVYAFVKYRREELLAAGEDCPRLSRDASGKLVPYVKKAAKTTEAKKAELEKYTSIKKPEAKKGFSKKG